MYKVYEIYFDNKENRIYLYTSEGGYRHEPAGFVARGAALRIFDADRTHAAAFQEALNYIGEHGDGHRIISIVSSSSLVSVLVVTEPIAEAKPVKSGKDFDPYDLGDPNHPAKRSLDPNKRGY